ncbi:P-loop containing nucleoside triphosphate hydrolase protein [Rhodofomes roseus]|uniref:DNA helicase n=1 Tax=Rhodofomes roseus TaxID=34475 RepID=A0ABQ8K266_9APHY|nr:P-loop containing nucleoside triphosphate hydrolase protein [Rhodofomes roseus]KAH9830595.1 P-loop containing nucleoside triphosphate hydrolase protein [Rhodofomes roseus]
MSTEQQLQDFITRQRSLLSHEREAEIERSSLLLSNCGPKLLEQKGLALTGLGVASIRIGLGGKTLVELERPAAYHSTPLFPPHTFRPGDLAKIEENASEGATRKKTLVKGKKADSSDNSRRQSTEGVVYKVSDTRIVIAVNVSESGGDELDIPERCRVLKLANSVTYDRMDKAIDQLEKMVLPNSATSETAKSAPEQTPLVRVLMGISRPSETQNIEDITFFDDSLNESQRDAIRFAMQAPEIACIHGPPGTGKTHTLIEIIRQITTVTPANPKPLRIMVCGASNLSVDNILERLLALPAPTYGAKLKVTRVGHPARVMAHQGVLDSTLEMKASRSDQAALARDVKKELEEALDILSGKPKGAKGKAPRGAERRKMWDEVKALRKEYRRREGGVVESVLSESQVVLATCHSAGGWQLRNHRFDVLIIDEATQAMEAVCWVPIFKAHKLILAGDPMQLPPTILSADKKRRDKKGGKGDKAKASSSRTTPQKNVPEPTKQVASPPANEITDPEADEPEDSDDGSSFESDAEIDEAKAPAEPVDDQESRRIFLKNELRPPRSLETTLFDRLEKMYGPGIKRLLNVQYRMHAQIAAFPSKVMYQNKLTSHPSVASHLLKDLPNANAADEDEEKELLGTPVAFFDTAGCEYYERVEGDDDEGSRCNENEATVVKKYVEELVGVGVLPSQIAVITPYQAQVTLLTSLLRPIYGLDLEIGTVDGMQGREKEAVIISLVRSNEKREVGFLKDKRRLNVAMTRARRHLCVVGDSSTIQHGGRFLKAWSAWLEANADVRFAGID